MIPFSFLACTFATNSVVEVPPNSHFSWLSSTTWLGYGMPQPMSKAVATVADTGPRTLLHRFVAEALVILHMPALPQALSARTLSRAFFAIRLNHDAS